MVDLPLPVVVAELWRGYRSLPLVGRRSGGNACRRLTWRGISEDVGSLLDSSSSGCRIFRVGHSRWDRPCRELSEKGKNLGKNLL